MQMTLVPHAMAAHKSLADEKRLTTRPATDQLLADDTSTSGDTSMSFRMFAILALAWVGAASPIQAGFVYVAQSRTVTASASEPAEGNHDLSTAAAIDFGPFIRTVHVDVGGDDPEEGWHTSASSTAAINSVLGTRSIVASGSATAIGEANMGFPTGSGSSSSIITVDFTLNLPVDRLATWTMQEGANSPGFVEGEVEATLTGPAFGPYNVNYSTYNYGLGNRNWQRTFLLPAGLHTYHLRVAAYGMGGMRERGTGSYAFTFSYVPEPSTALLFLTGLMGMLMTTSRFRRLFR